MAGCVAERPKNGNVVVIGEMGSGDGKRAGAVAAGEMGEDGSVFRRE